MSQYVDSATKTFVAGGALDQHLRVKLSSGKLAAAGLGAADEPAELGTIVESAFADGDARAVRLRNAMGTSLMVASKAITAGTVVFGAAAGKISDATSGAALGVALDDATADGDVIEVMRY